MTDYENVLLWPELLVIEHLDWQGFSLVLPTIIRLKTRKWYGYWVSLHFLMKSCTSNPAQIIRKRFLIALLSNGVVIASFKGAPPTKTPIHVKKVVLYSETTFQDAHTISASPLTTKFIGLNIDNLISMSKINQNHGYCTLLKPQLDVKCLQNPCMLAEWS